jgi:predicted metal-binding protein
MFGPGAYFAEASSKCDEYAREAIGDVTKGGRSGRRIPIQRATLAKLDSQRVVFVYV